VDGLWATKNEGVVLIVFLVSFQDFQLRYVVLIHQCCRRTDGQTDGRHAISIPRYALVHLAVMRCYIQIAHLFYRPITYLSESHESESDWRQ